MFIVRSPGCLSPEEGLCGWNSVFLTGLLPIRRGCRTGESESCRKAPEMVNFASGRTAVLQARQAKRRRLLRGQLRIPILGAVWSSGIYINTAGCEFFSPRTKVFVIRKNIHQYGRMRISPANTGKLK